MVVPSIWEKILLGFGFPAGTRGTQPHQEIDISLDPWVAKIPWSGGQKLVPAFLPAQHPIQIFPAGYTPRVKELDT